MDRRVPHAPPAPDNGGRPVSPAALRTFAGHFPTGVAVVTSTSPDGELCGVTINAVTSLSLKPPLFLVCLDHRSNTLAAVTATGRFALHFLGRDQTEVAEVFASKRPDKLAAVAHRIGAGGCPLIAGVLAAAECELVHAYGGGDHTIVIGRVETVHVAGGEPLLFHRGAYAALDSSAPDA